MRMRALAGAMVLGVAGLTYWNFALYSANVKQADAIHRLEGEARKHTAALEEFQEEAVAIVRAAAHQLAATVQSLELDVRNLERDSEAIDHQMRQLDDSLANVAMDLSILSSDVSALKGSGWISYSTRSVSQLDSDLNSLKRCMTALGSGFSSLYC